MKTFKMFNKWLKGLYLYLFTMLIFILITTYTRTWIPLFYAHVFDSILDNKASLLPNAFQEFIYLGTGIEQQLLLTGVALVGVMIFRGTIIFLEGRQGAYLSEKLAYSIRLKLYDHIQNLPFSYHTNAETGDLIQRSTSDVDTIRRFIGGQLAELLRSVLLFIFMFYSMYRLHVKLAFISIIVVPFIFGFALIYFKRIQKLFKTTEESESRMSTTLQENLTGIRVVKAFANEKYEIEKFDKASRDYTLNNIKVNNSMAVYWASSDFVCFLQIVMTVVFGAYFTMVGEISIGILVTFVTYVQAVLWPVRNLGRIIAEMGKSSISLGRIEEILAIEIEHPVEKQQTTPINGNIEFINTSFVFDDSKNATLNNINLKINHGETIAIIGRTGSGKSTLVNLLVRLLEYTGGSILLDGVELNTIDRKWVRKHIGIILQEPFLYSKSILQNIGILDKEMTEDMIYQAAKQACLHEDIESFEKGYETMVGERGVTLSGGQKQRLAIARMLTEEKPILIFDDSLSAVDSETDISIRKALDSFSTNVTKIIITHRVVTAMNADKIIILDEGSIVEEGSHNELLENHGIYRRLWDIQNDDQFLNMEEGEVYE